MTARNPIVGFICLLLLLGSAAVAEQVKGPPIERLVWHAPHRVRWRLTMGPVWYSMGHTNHVVCVVPRGVKAAGGRIVRTRDGSGAVWAVDVEVYRVSEFDEKTGLPLKVERLKHETITADDPEALKRKRWPFPTEQGKDFELSELAPLEHQALFRIFLHGDSQFWHTLMVHTEAKLGPMPEAWADAAGSKRCFEDMFMHTVVCELLHDPSIKMTSTYIEPDDPPSTWWIEKEKVPAPWAQGREKLAPTSGCLEFDEAGRPAFKPLSVEVMRSMRDMGKDAKGGTGGPELPTAPMGEREELEAR